MEETEQGTVVPRQKNVRQNGNSIVDVMLIVLERKKDEQYP
jgi:hypothetical protein